MAVRSSRSYVLSVLLHLSATITYGYSIYWCWTHPDVPTKNPKGVIGGRTKYLTIWDLWIQFFAFSLCLLTDILGNHSKSSVVVTVRNTVFNCLALPIGTFVVSTFWSIYAYDRELIFPVEFEKWYPNWLNHSTHTIVLPFLLLETYLVSHNRSRQKFGPIILLSVIIPYLVWVLFIALTTGHWVYPVLQVLNWPLRILFFLSNACAMLFVYYCGGLLDRLFWDTGRTEPTPRRKRN